MGSKLRIAVLFDIKSVLALQCYNDTDFMSKQFADKVCFLTAFVSYNSIMSNTAQSFLHTLSIRLPVYKKLSCLPAGRFKRCLRRMFSFVSIICRYVKQPLGQRHIAFIKSKCPSIYFYTQLFMSYLFYEIGIHRCFACLSHLASAIKSSAFRFY